jgi:DNA adenine methylase
MEDSNRLSRFESPLRYPGGKACLFSFFANLFYENDLIGTNYAEPYAGGAGLALKLLFNEFVNKIYINDLDLSIYNFWNTVLNSNQQFCEWIENVDVSINNWKHYKEVLKNSNHYSEFEIAKATFFLNRTNISGVIKGGPIGGYNQNGKFKIDARFNKSDLVKRIKRIHNFKNRIILTKIDGIKFIKKINAIKENMFIYIDPPYVQKGADLYMNFYKINDHYNLAKNIDKINKKWLISYDNNDYILKLYQHYNKILYRLSQSASNRIGNEIVILSDELKINDSISKLKEAINV